MLVFISLQYTITLKIWHKKRSINYLNNTNIKQSVWVSRYRYYPLRGYYTQKHILVW
jgi:hypothetical protein